MSGLVYVKSLKTWKFQGNYKIFFIKKGFKNYLVMNIVIVTFSFHLMKRRMKSEKMQTNLDTFGHLTIRTVTGIIKR